MKPTVAGSPARASIAIVSGQASSGRSAPRPWTERIESPKGVSRSRATITVKAARFMKA